jgi:hypothetical protein
MTGMRLFSEPFAPTGNLAAEGFRNLLGKPTLDQTQTVIREAIQNSVDAAESALGPRIEILFQDSDRKSADCVEAGYSSRPSCG